MTKEEGRNRITTLGIVVIVILALAIAAIIYLGIRGGNTIKKYNQTTGELTVARDSVKTLKSQLTLAESDINGLKSENTKLQSQYSDLLNDYQRILRERHNYLSQWEKALTKIANLESLHQSTIHTLDYKHHEVLYQKELEITDLTKRFDTLWTNYTELSLSHEVLWQGYQCEKNRSWLARTFGCHKCSEAQKHHLSLSIE